MGEQAKKTFSGGAILSVLHGPVVAKFDEVHALIEWVAGVPVWTHQLPRVCNEIRPHLQAQFPALAAMDLSMLNRETYTVFSNQNRATLTELHDVAQCPHPVELRNPLTELIDLMEGR